MGSNGKEKSMKLYRYSIQGFFLLLAVYLLINYLPSREFMLTTLALILVISVIFRNGFCGWICPLGTIVDIIRGLGKKISGLSFIKPLNKKYKSWIKDNRGILNKIDKYARFFKYIFLLWILQAAFLSIATIKEGEEHGIITVLYLVIALLVLSLFVDRAWCRYVCPLGAIIGVFGRISPTKVARDGNSCINCNLCSKRCPMNIDVAKKEIVKTIDCSTCLVCVDVCPIEGALDLKMNLPFAAKGKSSSPQIQEKTGGEANENI